MSRNINSTLVTVPNTDIELTLGHNTDQQEFDMLFHNTADDPIDAAKMQTADRIIVGYLVHDDGCENPLDNDAEGAIFEARRHAAEGHHEGFQKALGLNSDFRPDFDLIEEEVLVAAIHEDIRLSFEGKDDKKLFQKCFEHVCGNFSTSGKLHDPLAFVLESLHDENELTPVVDVDSYAMACWAKARLEGKIGNKYAVMLDVYEHGGISYNVSGEGQQCTFDTARGGAVWVPDAACIENFEDKALSFEENLKKAREYARGVAKEYTLWRNGECYGYIVDAFAIGSGDHEELEACWGFIGHEYAMESLKEAFNNHKENQDAQN